MYQNREFNQKFSPVNVGDELDVKIETVGKKGDGIAKKDGFVLFVPNTKEGDEVKIKVTRVLRNVGFAEVTGKSESKPEEAQAEQETPPEADSKEETDQEPAAEESEEAKAQDTEDFGEELEEKK